MGLLWRRSLAQACSGRSPWFGPAPTGVPVFVLSFLLNSRYLKFYFLISFLTQLSLSSVLFQFTRVYVVSILIDIKFYSIEPWWNVEYYFNFLNLLRLRVLICSSCGLGEECLTELKELKYIACTFCAGFMLRSHGEMDQCYMNTELKLRGPSAVLQTVFEGFMLPSCGQMKNTLRKQNI